MFDANQPAYQRFRSIYAERTFPIVAWVGAGLSAAAGLPSWAELRSHLDAAGRAKASSLSPADSDELLRQLNAIRLLADHWRAFERLRSCLGATTYREEVRQQLSPTVAPPRIYERLWRLGLRGVFSLNLDRFASRSFSALKPGAVLHECTGRDLGAQLHILRSTPPFVANLHGIAEDERSWVLTQSDLSRVLRDANYATFINSVLATHVVVFVGIGADDIAAGGFLERLTMSGSVPGTHFWITSRTDASTDRWAEQSGIQVIRYDGSNGHAALDELLDDLERFVPKDDEAPPVHASPHASSSDPLPTPADLARKDPETIRNILNAHAAVLLSPHDDAAYQAYADFCDEYRRALYVSWYVSENPPDNVVFGYAISRRLAEGAFGKVYEAISPSGDQVAVKLLRNEIHNDKAMLGCFRRGVRSMQILADRKVAGVVPYLEAYELPACAVMEYIDGPTLEQVVEQNRLTWDDRLRVALDLVRTVRQGHLLPERVLHRDIRPPNVMLKGFEHGPWEVVVLDFDLSWHRDATEKSLELSGATALGYLAPEQISPKRGVSTRNALVDSFGLGMTLFYMVTAENPEAGAALSATWAERVNRGVRAKKCDQWRSLPNRIARLIVQSTRPEQKERLGADHIEAELEKLTECLQPRPVIVNVELWTEEVLQRAFEDDYRWSPDSLSGTVHFASGVELTLGANELAALMTIRIRWTSSGNEDWKRIGKYLPARLDALTQKLRKAGWTMTDGSHQPGTFLLEGTIEITKVRTTIDEVALAVSEARNLRFD